jgi:DNA-binding MarR family transcriptional regulator
MFGFDEAAHYLPIADFRSALRRFLTTSDATVRAHGLTPGQYDLLVMCEAAGAEGTTINSLAERLALAANSVTELVDRAVAAGLAHRHPDAALRRDVNPIKRSATA